MDDFRISTNWRNHPKRLKLERRLGRDAVLAVQDLWGFCAATPSRRSGDLTGMDDEDIALAAGYPIGNAVADADYTKRCAAFVAVLADLRLLDGVPGAYCVHDFEENNPHVASDGHRSAAAKSNANIRWHKAGKHQEKPLVGCKLCEEEEMQKNTISATACETMPEHKVAYAPVRPFPLTLETDIQTRAREETSTTGAPILASKFEEILSSPPYSWKPPRQIDRERIQSHCPVPQAIWHSALKIALTADKPNYAYFASVLDSEVKSANKPPGKRVVSTPEEKPGGDKPYHKPIIFPEERQNAVPRAGEKAHP